MAPPLPRHCGDRTVPWLWDTEGDNFHIQLAKSLQGTEQALDNTDTVTVGTPVVA